MTRLDSTVDSDLAAAHGVPPYLVVTPSLAKELEALLAKDAAYGRGKIIHMNRLNNQYASQFMKRALI
jgi:hypothetical protein